MALDPDICQCASSGDLADNFDTCMNFFFTMFLSVISVLMFRYE